MKTYVWRVILTLLVVLMFAEVSQSASVGKIVGLTSACDSSNTGCVPFPANASLLCDGTGAVLDCPQFFSPDWSDNTGMRFFGITNRANPPRCVTSTGGGVGWGLCNAGTVSPFTGALNDLGANFAVASNGALIAAGSQGVNLCTIRRSTDQGTTWNTVFTDSVTANVSCGLLFGNPTPNTLRCASNSGYCVMMATITGGFQLLAYFSNDNGATWTTGTPFTVVSADSQISIAVGSGGTSGSLSRFTMNYNTANRVFANTTGGDWTVTGLIPTSPGSADGQNLRCIGAFIFNGQSVLCGPDQTATSTYRLFAHSGAAAPTLTSSVIPQNGLTNAQTPDFMAVGYNSTTAYMVGRNAANTQLVIWATRDSFTTLIQIGTLTPTTALAAGAPRGDIFSRNGKIYFSGGAGGSSGFLGVIQ